MKEVYAYEVPSSAEWSFNQFESCFRPNVFSDITSTLSKKIEAVQIYGDEVRSFPHPRSPEAIRYNAGHWGSTVGVEAAEAFTLVRLLR